MRAEITRQEDGYKAVFERKLKQDAAQVWSMLTENSNLEQWCPQLRIAEVGKDGKFIYTHKDGTAEAIPITEYTEDSILALNWQGDDIHFEIKRIDDALSMLRLIKKSDGIVSQSATDLAAWHIGLNRMEALLNNEESEETQSHDKWTKEYKRLLDSMNVEFE